MRAVVVFGALAGCTSYAVPEFIPLTVEQALPDTVPVQAVRERAGCYYYEQGGAMILLPTQDARVADWATPVCATG